MTTSALVHVGEVKNFVDAYHVPSRSLHAIIASNPAPPFEDLLGWEFNGMNIGLLPGMIGIRKFRKGFYEGPARSPEGPTPFIQGYNIPVKQNGVGREHIGKPSNEHPKRFGFYRVYRAEQSRRFNRFPQALLLDYGMGRNGLDPSGFLRDYLVQFHAGSSDILLGYAFVNLGLFALPVSFFVLERARQHEFRG